MTPAFILADRLLNLLKDAGVTQGEAQAALLAAVAALPTFEGIYLFPEDQRPIAGVDGLQDR